MSRFLDDFTRYIREKGYNVFSAAEICGGAAEAVQLANTNRCQDSYSVSKAFVVTAIGLLFDEGKLTPDDRVTAFFPEYVPADERWHTTTVDMALRHCLGLPGGYLDIDCVDMKEFGRDLLACLFAHPLLCPPGEQRVYTDAAYYLLGRVAERVSGRRLNDYLWEKLFWPMEFTEAAWSTCPMGHAMGATGLYITSADMAKLGELYRCGGLWNGERILSEEWVRMVLQRGYELRPVGVGEAYGKGGMYNQMLLVVPETARVVAWHAFENHDINKDLIHFCAQYR